MGFLFGASCDAELYIHGYAAAASESGDKLKDEVDRITQCLPGGRLECHILNIRYILQCWMLHLIANLDY